MTASESECDKILHAAEKSAGKLMVGQCVRFMKHYSYLKEVVESKEYGRLISVKL